VLDLACSSALAALAVAVTIAYAVRVSRRGAARFARVDRAGRSPLLGRSAMQMGYWAMRPVALALVAVGVSANAISWASLALAAAAGASLAAGRFGLGAALSLASSSCDALDGMVARETATASESGEVLDATIDRYAELLFFGGVAVQERQNPGLLVLTLAAAAGAIMVSYATAKAESLQVDAPRGAMRRPERAVYLVLGAALVPVAAAARARWGLPPWVEQAPLAAVLTLVAVVGNASAVGRLAAVARELGARREPDSDRTAAPDRSTGNTDGVAAVSTSDAGSACR
jgi:CDP-diacylglycerol--glycerol-3-phosphate 3-phosphatidyltransferase